MCDEKTTEITVSKDELDWIIQWGEYYDEDTAYGLSGVEGIFLLILKVIRDNEFGEESD